MKKVIFLLAAGLTMSLHLIAQTPGQTVNRVKRVFTVNDEFDELRVKCIEYMTGGTNYDLNNKNIKFAMSELTSRATDHWTRMLKKPEKFLWSDQSNLNSYSHTYGSFSRLADMCLAYSTFGSALYQNVDLRKDILMGFEWVVDNMFHTGKAMDPNQWWAIEVGSSQAMGYVMLHMYEYFTPEQLKKWCDTFDYWHPNGLRGAYPEWGFPNGTNMTNRCVAFLSRAICGKDAVIMEKVRVALNGTFFYANGINAKGTDLEDGYYRDGSYLLHIGLAHTGGYGTAHLENLPYLIYALSNTKWSLDQDRINMAWDWIYNSYMPVMFKGGVFDFVKDREISRAGLQSHVMGQRIASALAGLALAAPEPHKSYFQSVVKGWIQADYTRDFFADIHQENQRLHIAATIRMEQLMNDASIKPITEYTMGRMFAVAARAVSFRPGYAYGVAMNCSRMKYYETIHGENLQGWYMNEGMTFFVNNDDLGQYDGDYWATVNWHRLPGTTIDVIERAKQEAGSTSNKYIYSKHHWAGGVQMGDRYVATGYHMDAYNVTLTARKSWFMLDNKIIALGADINSTDNRTIETIVDNRKLNSNGNNLFIVDGKEKSKDLDWSEKMTKVSWMWLETTGGYYFPKKTGINALREKRTGSWSMITQGGDRTPINNNFLTLSIDHGKSPSGASYEYVFLPNATADFTKKFAQNPDFEILENSKKAQGIFDKPSGVTAVNFWTEENYTVGGITSSGHASVMVWKNAYEVSVAISEPTWQNKDKLRVKIAPRQKYTFGKTVSKDERITVVENTGSAVVLEVDLSGRPNGATFTVTFTGR